MTAGLPVTWATREPPLWPIAVIASGAAARALADRLDGALGAEWRGIGGPGWIAVVGPEPPWVDGATFLGRDPAAPRLLMPTRELPACGGVSVAGLLDDWVARKCAGRPGPYGVVPGLGVVPLGGARPIAAAGVAAWRGR